MKRLLLLLTLGLLSSAVGAGPKPKEGLGFGLSGDWSVGFHKDEGATSITEFVPHDEKVESWTRLVTRQRSARVLRAVAAAAGRDLSGNYEVESACGEDERSALIAGVLAVHLERAPDAR